MTRCRRRIKILRKILSQTEGCAILRGSLFFYNGELIRGIGRRIGVV